MVELARFSETVKVELELEWNLSSDTGAMRRVIDLAVVPTLEPRSVLIGRDSTPFTLDAAIDEWNGKDHEVRHGFHSCAPGTTRDLAGRCSIPLCRSSSPRHDAA